jgi:peptidoglycan/LPS O-acetylase OafA/YrhL
VNKSARVLGARSTIGESFSSKHNSLNFLRLVLALLVLISHAVPLGNFGDSWIVFKGTPVGTLAVYGFFGISGFLIAGSAVRNGVGRYLWQRFLRIFPGFWVCLVITAFVIGLVGWLVQSGPHCGISCYMHARQSPFDYVFGNAFLKMTQSSIAGTPTALPNAWNGSLWTLFYEFLCYLFLMGLAMFGLLRNRVWVLALTIVLWVTACMAVVVPSLDREINLSNNATEMYFLRFVTIFMVGAVIYLYRDHVPDSGWLALICAVAFVAGMWLPAGGYVPAFDLTASYLVAPLVAYPLLWLGIHLPFDRVGSQNDYSYGVYIYAYPVTVLLAIWHAEKLGEPVFIVLCIVATAPFAMASWWLIEKRALRLKRMDPKAVTTWISRSKHARPTGSTEAGRRVLEEISEGPSPSDLS